MGYGNGGDDVARWSVEAVEYLIVASGVCGRVPGEVYRVLAQGEDTAGGVESGWRGEFDRLEVRALIVGCRCEGGPGRKDGEGQAYDEADYDK